MLLMKINTDFFKYSLSDATSFEMSTEKALNVREIMLQQRTKSLLYRLHLTLSNFNAAVLSKHHSQWPLARDRCHISGRPG